MPSDQQNLFNQTPKLTIEPDQAEKDKQSLRETQPLRVQDLNPSQPQYHQKAHIPAIDYQNQPQNQYQATNPSANRNQALALEQNQLANQPPNVRATQPLEPVENTYHAQNKSRLTARGLKKTYSGRTVVENTSLEINSGEVIGLLGPNGAGKTTSFYMIVGLVRLDGGNISLDNVNMSRMPIHERARLGLAYLPQEPSIFRKLTVSENIMAILETKPYSKAVREEQLEQLLVHLRIKHIHNSLAVSLSGGERRRVEIARCLATNPKFVLLDEPFAGIDPIAVIEIQKIIRFLASQNIGVLITDHNVRETLGICDRAYIVNNGSIFAAGTPTEIIQNEAVREVYLGKNFRL